MTHWMGAVLAIAMWGCGSDDADPAEPAVDAASTLDVSSGADAGQGADHDSAIADAGPVDVDASVQPDALVIPDLGPDALIPDAAVFNDCPAPGTEVRMTTEDGVELVADLYAVPGAERGVVLLHMIPPSNNRENYPLTFIQALNDRGLSVINVDRRGAGDSGGIAREAYEGPNGRLDVIAARRALEQAECGVDPEKITLVGASNGTTSVLDFTVAAGTDEPMALVFLTGGGYTENQHQIADSRAVLDRLPITFVFSTAERRWSAGFADGAPENWSFMEYEREAHGTNMFEAVPRSITEIADVIAIDRD